MPGESGVRRWCEHRAGRFGALPFDDGSFDAVRAERLFQHLLNPAPHIPAKWCVWHRKGGYVVVLDTDYASGSIALDEHELERRFSRDESLEHSVKNGYAAREMPLLFQRAELDES